MARRIAPGTPTPIEALDVNVPDIDLSIFDQYGDYKIKSAMQNFQLYATTTANAEAQKAYQKYKNNPIALANALTKLPDMFNDLPKSVQAELKPKLDSNAISLVTKAQANQQAAINKQNKALAQANVVLNMNQLATDAFNNVRFMSSPKDEQRTLDRALYLARRTELENLINITDEDGKPMFSETQRAKMIMPKEAIVNGVKEFINRMELDQLTEWDKNIFQNQSKFMEDMKIDSDVYETIDTYVKSRMKALKDTSIRELHGQAYYDQLNLITEPTQLNIEKAKSYEFTNDKDIDKLAENAKAATLAKYYAPDQPTSPTAFMNAYVGVGELIKSLPDNISVAEQQNVIAALANAESQLLLNAQATNMKPEDVNSIQQTLYKAVSDKVAKQAILDVNFGSRYTDYMNSIPQEMLQGPMTAKKKAALLKAPEEIKMGIKAEKESIQSTIDELTVGALRRYNIDMANAIHTYLAGDINGFKQQVVEADRRFDKTRASFIVPDEFQWQRLENALAQGKPALIEYRGRVLQFNGFDNRGALFTETN